MEVRSAYLSCSQLSAGDGCAALGAGRRMRHGAPLVRVRTPCHGVGRDRYASCATPDMFGTFSEADKHGVSAPSRGMGHNSGTHQGYIGLMGVEVERQPDHSRKLPTLRNSLYFTMFSVSAPSSSHRFPWTHNETQTTSTPVDFACGSKDCTCTTTYGAEIYS